MASNTTQSAVSVFAAPSITIDLKAEIEARIKPYKDSEEKPPVEVEELAVMAWVCNTNRYIKVIGKGKVFKWLITNFDYYALVALTDAERFGNAVDNAISQTSIREISSLLSSRLHEVEVPMWRVKAKNTYSTEERYVSTLASSRMFLREALQAEEASFTRFFDLPTEIRLKIYEEALTYPGSLECGNRQFRGTLKAHYFDVMCLEWQRTTGRKALDQSQSRDFRRTWSPETMHLKTKISKNILGLLLANRQIFAEAVPVFYDINTFVCDIYGLVSMLRNCGARRRAYFSRLEIDCTQYRIGVLTTKSASILLAEATHLKDVRIKVHDDTHPLKVQRGDPRPPGTLHKVSLINMFIGLRTRSLRFASGSPEIEGYVQNMRSNADNEDSKAIAKMKTPIKSRKRKAPMSAEFCTADDNVPVKKARNRAAPKPKKFHDPNEKP